MRRARASSFALATFVLGSGAALAQDKPPAPPPAPSPVAPEELARVRAQLERIESERKKLAGDQAVLEAKQRELEAKARGLPTSPVLRPRDKVRAVTLHDAVARALSENADLLVAYLAAIETREDWDVQRAAFDPTLKFSAIYGRNRTPFSSQNPFTGLPSGTLVANESMGWTFSTRLEQRLPTGTNLAIEYDDGSIDTNNKFSLNPSFTPKTRVEVSQNVLKGFGLDANLAGMRAAEADAQAAGAGYLKQLMDVIFNVESSYWDVVRAEEQLRTNESALRSAMELLNDNRKRKELGNATGLEVTIAEAGVAQRREGVIVAENQLEAARDALIRIIDPPGAANRYDVFVVPVDRPMLVDEPEVDLDRAIDTAIARRPDYRQVTLQLESARQHQIQADNGALPQVDIVATFEEDGLGQSWNDAWRSFGPFWSWSGGVRVQLPLFLRSERAQARKAAIEVDRQEAALRALEAQVQLEVRKAVRDLRTARARIDAARAARELAEKQLDAMKAQVLFGVSVPRQILDFQSDLAQARSQEVQAHIDYRLALTSLARVQGTLLDSWQSQLPERAKEIMTPGAR